MSLTVNVYYHGKNGSAKQFADEMVASGLVAEIRAKQGNLKYDYYLPYDDAETILLIDQWENQQTLDAHHDSTTMQKILNLRAKYKLTLTVYCFVDKQDEISEKDKSFIN